ncbi:MAG: hypothetical protein ACFFD3_01215 [Candidatus Thorarchaeota archaeon]
MRLTLILLECEATEIAMSDVNERLREKTMQIAMLNQKMEALQAQLGGAQRRASQLNEQVQSFEALIREKDYEIQSLTAELKRTQEALDVISGQIQGAKPPKRESEARKTDQDISRENLQKAEGELSRLKEDVRALSQAATDVLLEKSGSMEKLRRAVSDVGDIQHRILNLVLENRSLKIDELASMTLTDISSVMRVVDSLQAAGEVMLKESNTVIPAKKYRETRIPVEDWMKMEPSEIFDSLESFVEKVEGNEAIVEALERAVEILEQKMSRGGSLVFQMRRTATDWKRNNGDIEELRYAIRDWKSRALS